MLQKIVVSIALITLQSCNKFYELQPTNEVEIAVINQCFCKITFYRMDNSVYVSDYFDCNETQHLYLQIRPGNYKIKAQSGSKKIEKYFTKDLYNSSLLIEFP